jgi:general stress protein 26
VSEPRSTTRPRMPDYGIAPEDEGELLPWSWAVERLEASRNYWVATSGADGVPHLAAVWGVWHDGAFWFSTGGRSRKARNLAANPRCSIAPERADESVVCAGTAVRVTDDQIIGALRRLYIEKYGEGFPDPDANPLFRIEPTTVIGIIESEPEFSTRATRWTFGELAGEEGFEPSVS